MNLLNQDQVSLLQSAFSKLKINSDNSGIEHIIGNIVGFRMSLLGVTQNKDSLYAPKLQVDKIMSELNEVYIIDLNRAKRIANEIIDCRWNAFFDTTGRAPGFYMEGFRYGKECLAALNSMEVVEGFADTISNIIGGTPITTMIHNRQPQAQPAPQQPASTPQPQTPPSQPTK